MVVYVQDRHDNIRILQIHLHHVPIHDGMSSGQLRETLLKKPLLYIRLVAGVSYVRGLRIIGHIDVIVTKNPLATTRCAGRKSEMADWNGPVILGTGNRAAQIEIRSTSSRLTSSHHPLRPSTPS